MQKIQTMPLWPPQLDTLTLILEERKFDPKFEDPCCPPEYKSAKHLVQEQPVSEGHSRPLQDFENPWISETPKN